MVVEYIRYRIDDGRSDAFEQAYGRAGEALQASEHCERYHVTLASSNGARAQ
jgi:hypothetical protein